MNDDLIFFSMTRQRHLDESKLRVLLHTHIACSEAQTVRQWLTGIVVVFSLPLWIADAWPAALSPRLRSGALATWAAGIVALAIAAIVEWWCRRQRTRCLRQLPPTTLPVQR